MEIQSNKISWFLSKHIPEAYEKGIKSKESDINPFEDYTNEWYSWNAGYNQMISNIIDIELQESLHKTNNHE